MSAAVVILSSSPPRMFARSPTPAETPPPLRSPCTLSTGEAIDLKQFKISRQVRDGFSGGFGSPLALLTTKVGAENIPLLSPRKDRFKAKSSPQTDELAGNSLEGATRGKKKGGTQAEERSKHFEFTESFTPKPIPRPKISHAIKPLNIDALETAPKQSGDERGLQMSRHSRSPFAQEKAIPRRLDWTPVKPKPHDLETPQSEDRTVGFSNDLMKSYAFPPAARMAMEKTATKPEANQERPSRRSIDLVMNTEARSSPSLLTSKACENLGKGASNGKAKPPAKKALTITGLATSHYGDSRQKETKLSPMLEYLTATQVGAESEAGSVTDVSLKVSKSKVPCKKARPTKKAPAKTRLKSPSSAIKSNLEQPYLFGPASQLARDESPTLTRDTLEVLKRSECLSSDPISPLSTQPISIESTSPKACRGTGRFVKRRDLWGAAGRDEDNALLQVDTVDLTDSPAVRLALAGKDVLLQSIGPNHQDIDTLDNSPPGPPSRAPPSNAKEVESPIDIDDIVTPRLPKSIKPPTQARARLYHTSRTLKQPQKAAKINQQDSEAHSEAKSAVSNPPPIMPSYVGFSDYELKKQITAYGFKAVKKREAMIELLERCWESKHGVQYPHDDESVSIDAMTHGDLLSKIHDVSTRPVPKLNKSRAKRKSESGDMGTANEPKKRKKTATKSSEPAQKEGKAARKRASKTFSDEKVVDVDDLDEFDNHNIEVKHRSEPLGLQNEPERLKSKLRPTTQKPLTPPPTMPQERSAPSQGCQPSRPLSANNISRLDGPAAEGPGLTPQQTPAPNILSQIDAAISRHPETQSKDGESRNHQISPTWHEKILMYDPIVLEELTVWLNTEGLNAIGEDREVSLLEVRAWCEQNGVCCYGVTGGWRGRGRPS
ncbi:uncharacterized protein Z519_10904 [Cladophialophora bantiana CBS 173.52]|uniref:Structure-specific endonuclease subunit SLX4 n=1 Tax=Cladophialophora bantiana (strain ATCC 10958 / CBS 173.52 / CDC B-1940 / NIH 8579) TaxID=1442370 RepID=A0A0D2EDX2_CLAB1|nr:uncharacterized protein Z519_10904 [Cladophialophora bantiana CBS 173.52]KIW88336.1 hypothetical protein Z519_10904 [Cladophialophora bantiana CBS 173.52]